MKLPTGTHLIGDLSPTRKAVMIESPGIYTGITQEEYRWGVGVPNSSLGLLMKSGRSLWWETHKKQLELEAAGTMDDEKEEDEDELGTPEEKRSAALTFGAAMHKIVLEPETWEDEFVVVPPSAPRKPTEKQRNAAKPSAATIDAIAYWDDFTAKAAGKQLVTYKEFQRMMAMLDALKGHWFEIDGYKIPTIKLFQNGTAEASMYWVDENTGVLCKGRPDYISDGFLADYKTTADGSLYGFQKSMADFGYYRQSPFYLDGARLASGGDINHNRFVFVVQEKKEPYEVFVYAIGPGSMEIGRQDYHILLERFKENTAMYGPLTGSNPWPMASHVITDVELPQWAMYQGGLVK